MTYQILNQLNDSAARATQVLDCPFQPMMNTRRKLQSQASGTQASSSAESDVNMEMISLALASPLPPEISSPLKDNE